MVNKGKNDDSAKDVNEKVEETEVEGEILETKNLETNAPEEEEENTEEKVEEVNSETEAPELAVSEDQSPEENKVEEKEDEFGNGFFFIEDGEFFEKLSEKITDKKNIDDFSFVDAATLPAKVRIMQRSEDWKIKTTSKRGDLKGKEGDFLLFDPNGNKLKVSGPMFRKLYNTLFGE